MFNQQVVKFISGYPLQEKDSPVIDEFVIQFTKGNFPYLERISVNPNIHFGKPVIKSTRITVQNVLELLSRGISFDQIVRDYYPDLKREDVQACLQYAIALIGNEESRISSVVA